MCQRDRNSVLLRQSSALEGVDCIRAKFFNHDFPVHAHTGFCLGVILDGAQEFRHGRRHAVASNGELMLINPNEEHTGRAVGRSWSHIAIFVEPSAASMWWSDIYSDKIPVFKGPIARDPVAGALMQGLAKAMERHHDALTAQTRFVELGRALAKHNAYGCRLPPSDPSVSRVRALLDDTPTDDSDLQTLADEAGLTPLQLLRSFRASFGCTPHVYRTARRLRLARRLLEAGEPIAQAALATGFCDQSHLARTLRHWMGVTPRQLSRIN